MNHICLFVGDIICILSAIFAIDELIAWMARKR